MQPVCYTADSPAADNGNHAAERGRQRMSRCPFSQAGLRERRENNTVTNFHNHQQATCPLAGQQSNLDAIEDD